MNTLLQDASQFLLSLKEKDFTGTASLSMKSSREPGRSTADNSHISFYYHLQSTLDLLSQLRIVGYLSYFAVQGRQSRIHLHIHFLEQPVVYPRVLVLRGERIFHSDHVIDSLREVVINFQCYGDIYGSSQSGEIAGVHPAGRQAEYICRYLHNLVAPGTSAADSQFGYFLAGMFR